MIMSFSQKLAQAMKDKEMSTRRLSELTGIPKSAIQRYTSGETEKIPIDRMIRMADAMGIDPAYVMGWADDPAAEISAAIGSYSPAAKKLQQIKSQFKSPMIEEMAQAMGRMTLKEQKKMLDVGKALFPERFENKE